MNEMKILIVAEKPDMGRNIAAVMEPKARNHRTYLEGEQYIITWAIGHLIGLAEPDAYDPKYKKWNFGDLPIIPEQFKIVPNPRTKDQLNTIGELAKRCDRIVNACDAGREGQHIFALIQRQLKLTQPVKRLWISDLTPESIRKGFVELKDGQEFDNLTRAARARSEADWLIGMNASRAFTIKHNNLLSVGRVQTPVLALIYDRQKEIEAFDSQTFYEVRATFKQADKSYTGVWQGDRITDQAKGQAIVDKVKGKEGRITKYDIRESKEYPYKLYDLTLLQRDANAKFGYSAKKTLDTAQALYEKHKVISYPRTNSNYVTEQNIDGMHKVLGMLKNTPYEQLAEGAEGKRVHINNKAVCNPSKVEDHHAILPTLKKPGTLSKEEQQLYDLIVRRFLAQFYPPAEYKHHTVMTTVEQETFKTAVKELLFLGWKATLPDKDKSKSSSKSASKGENGKEEEPEEEVQEPFVINDQQSVQCSKAEVKEKATQPPKHYTEGTLLKAMESAGKQIENEELRDAMKESGLGTPATRAATIERLKQVGYINTQGKKMELTLKGRAAIELIRAAGVELLTSPEMTGQWERRLNQISRGEADSDRFLESVKKFAASVIEKVKTQTPAIAGRFGDDSRSNSKGKRSSTSTKTASSKGSTGTTNRSKSSAANQATTKSASNKAPSTARSATATVSMGAAGEHTALGTCPNANCGGQIIEGRKGYGCSHFKKGCTFVIWKEFAGKKISVSMLKTLLQKGETQALAFKKGDETHKGRIKLVDQESGKLIVEAVK